MQTVLAHWINISEFFYLRYRDILHAILGGSDWLKTSFRASKIPCKLMMFKTTKNA
jgi:hypothetical protein